MDVGQPTFVSSWKNNPILNNGSDIVADGNYAWELWYRFQFSDHISVAPGLYI